VDVEPFAPNGCPQGAMRSDVPASLQSSLRSRSAASLQTILDEAPAVAVRARRIDLPFAVDADAERTHIDADEGALRNCASPSDRRSTK
jgi:hypothetical protein